MLKMPQGNALTVYAITMNIIQIDINYKFMKCKGTHFKTLRNSLNNRTGKENPKLKTLTTIAKTF